MKLATTLKFLPGHAGIDMDLVLGGGAARL